MSFNFSFHLYELSKCDLFSVNPAISAMLKIDISLANAIVNKSDAMSVNDGKSMNKCPKTEPPAGVCIAQVEEITNFVPR